VRLIRLSRAEVVAIAIASTVLVLQALPGAGPALEYRHELLVAQPWRWISGNLVHVNWQHAVINALALWIVARLYAPDLTAGRQLAVMLGNSLAVGLALAVLYPSITWYRGLSGVLHGLFFTGAALWLMKVRPWTLRTLWLPSALFFGGWIQVVLEQPDGATTPYVEWLGAGVVPQAHLVGAVCGTIIGLGLAISDARAANHQQHGQQ